MLIKCGDKKKKFIFMEVTAYLKKIMADNSIA